MYALLACVNGKPLAFRKTKLGKLMSAIETQSFTDFVTGGMDFILLHRYLVLLLEDLLLPLLLILPPNLSLPRRRRAFSLDKC
jgi:hypothetical protein